MHCKLFKTVNSITFNLFKQYVAILELVLSRDVVYVVYENKKKKFFRKLMSSSESKTSSESDSDSYVEVPKKKRKTTKRTSSKAKASTSKKKVSYEEPSSESEAESDDNSEKEEEEPEVTSSESSSDSYVESPKKKPKVTKKTKAKGRATQVKKKVNYQEATSESEPDSDEVLEWDEGQATPSAEENHAEVVEKVLKHRYGRPGATGSFTTDYNVQVNGDPNATVDQVDQNDRELQFLIKWTSWSHWHNTWESQKSLEASGAKGFKKLDNYLKKMTEVEMWKRRADKEYIEVYDCEQEMNDELYEQYKVVERVIGHQISRDKNQDGEKQYEYLVKWSCLSYADCTWEDENLIRRRYSHRIDEYMKRMEAQTIPHKSQVVSLFTFVPIFRVR